MIDIHCHVLYGVDDGAKDLEESMAMLRDAKAQGMRAIIATPHLRHGMFPYPKERIVRHFECLKPQAEALGIALYLGCEHHVSSQTLEELREGTCFTLAKGDWVLAEYSFETPYSQIKASLRELISCGYIPVVAHAERYQCFQKAPGSLRELSAVGALIQLNADSILGIAGRIEEKTARKLLKGRLAHLVASDAHGAAGRINRLGECRKFVTAKYGEAYARELFVENPQKIIM